MLPEDPILLPEIIDHVFLVAVHPASGREYEEAQSVGHSLTLLREQPLAPTLFRRFANLGRFVAPYGMVPAVVRVDNEKTAIGHGAGAWGRVTAAYRRYAETVRFHVDACPPRVLRRPRGRSSGRSVRSAAALIRPAGIGTLSRSCRRGATRRMRRLPAGGVCPATGTSVWEAWQAERVHLAPLPLLPEPFGTVRRRTPD